ncbi:MAG: hypothetical protein LBC27_08015 [Spirochaetaceae bacterium]|nr:hypothetical protein [Spirochaetaceae bacterium]
METIRFFKRQRGANVLLPLVLLICASCSTRINGEIHSNGRAEIIVKSSLQPVISNILKNLAARGGGGKRILDAALLNRSISRMVGVEAATLDNTAGNSVEGRIVISDVRVFLNSAASAVKQGSFAYWEETPYGGSFKLNMTRDTGHTFLSLLAPELVDYLSVLMAPIATGEIIDKAGYLELLASVYGPAIADELTRSNLVLSIYYPGPVERMPFGTYRGNHTEFTIPLLDVLVLDVPIVYEVVWTSWR